MSVRPEDLGPEWLTDKVVIAEVLKVEKHPNADKLRLVTVKYGAAEPKVVVTGAPNINIGDVGQKVVLGLAGTRYLDTHVDPPQIKELKPSVLRGVPSDAMVMSERELGISDEHTGIILLETDAPVGVPAAQYFGDAVVEVDVLPNMARCLNMIGVAREVAAITGTKLKYPDVSCPRAGESISGQVAVRIDDPKLCARYMALLIRNVAIGPSPGWMQRRLTYAGMRPISGIVDITNYVMLEWGQPLHAFDFDVLVRRANGKPPTIIVRSALPGEKLVTLDKVERPLTPDMLVIADTAGPIALAGVMGGLETEVTDQTKNVLLESANFDYVSIRRTMRALSLPSEASLRFSKGIHPETVGPAAERAAQLMTKHAGGAVCSGAFDCYPSPKPAQAVELSIDDIRRVLGIDMPISDAEQILKSLEYEVVRSGNGMKVTPPPHRIDIQEGAADLIEDIVRIYGYDRLPATLLADALPEQRGNESLELEERTRDLLAGAGIQEAITYSLTTPLKEAPLTGGNNEYVTLLNPISADRTSMRRTVLSGLLEVAAANLKHSPAAAIFEIGFVYLPQSCERLPAEQRRAAIVMSGRRSADHWSNALDAAKPNYDFFDLKGVVESMISALHVSNVQCRRSIVAWLHPGKAAELLIDGKSAGHFGELHPRATPNYDLAGQTVLVAELDLDVILAKVPDRFRCLPVPRFPAAKRDIALVIDEQLTAERVVAELRAAGGDLLREATLFDVYRGPSIDPGTKSLAYALIYQASDRTLTDKEVDQAHKKIESRVVHVLKAKIRGK
jgi:phenylalanyl-tRNA synthetase beta chain